MCGFSVRRIFLLLPNRSAIWDWLEQRLWLTSADVEGRLLSRVKLVLCSVVTLPTSFWTVFCSSMTTFVSSVIFEVVGSDPIWLVPLDDCNWAESLGLLRSPFSLHSWINFAFFAVFLKGTLAFNNSVLSFATVKFWGSFMSYHEVLISGVSFLWCQLSVFYRSVSLYICCKCF